MRKPLTIEKQVRKELVASIKRYAQENLDEEMGDLKAGLLLDYFLEEIGPTVYNLAIRDAQTHLQEKVTDLDAVCYRDELPYWQDS